MPHTIIISLRALWISTSCLSFNGPLARYVILLVAHAPGMPGKFHRHRWLAIHTCIMGSLTSGFLWSRWRGKRSRYSRHMRNPLFYVSGKRPIPWSNNIRKEGIESLGHGLIYSDCSHPSLRISSSVNCLKVCILLWFIHPILNVTEVKESMLGR